jgi:hypothetical protein
MDYNNYRMQPSPYDPIGNVDNTRPRAMGGPVSGQRDFVSSSQSSREKAIRIYVTLKKAYEGEDDYK